MANRPRRQQYEREVYHRRSSPPRKRQEYVSYPREEQYYKSYHDEYARGRHKQHNGIHTKEEDYPDRNLYEWGKWRTEINSNIIKDVMKTRPNEYQSGERLIKTNDGYKHDRTGGKVRGDPRYVMGYSLSTNQVTELSPEEFLTYGIPRAKVNLNHRAKNQDQLVNGYDKYDRQIPNGHDYHYEEKSRQNKLYKDHNYRHEQKVPQRERRRSPDKAYYGQRSPSPHKQSNYRNGSPNKRDYDRLPRHNEHQPAHHRGRHDSPHQKPHRRDSPPNERYNNYDSTQLSDDDDSGRQYDDRRTGDYEAVPQKRNSLVIDDGNLFTPRTDYSHQNTQREENNDQNNKYNDDWRGNEIPESLQKVFAGYKGANQPVRVIPMPPPPPPLPPPPPPLPPQ